jgi:penicillin-binding protein 1A
VLEQNMLYGTGRGAHISGRTDAGKTGTTDNYADAWFSGYTPYLEATVWMGYPSGEIPMLNVHGIVVSGPTFPAQIWHAYMETAIGKHPDVPFPAARSEPSWVYWHGQYEYSGSYGYSSSRSTSTSTSTATTTTRTAPPPAGPVKPATTTEPAQPTTTPATTTEPEPPPATTTEPPTTPATTEAAVTTTP